MEVCRARTLAMLVVGIVWTMSRVDALETFYLTDFCQETFSLRHYNVMAFILYLTRNATYSPNMDCDMKIVAPNGYRMLFNFVEMNVHSCEDHADLYEYRIDHYQSIDPEICTIPSQPLATNRDHASLGFFSNKEGEGRGFKVVVTAFHTAICNKSEFSCANGRCIDKKFNCSGYDNCGDNSNNSQCGIGEVTKIIIQAVFSIFSLIAFAGVFLFCRRRVRMRGFSSMSCPSCPSCSDCSNCPDCPSCPSCPKLPSPSFPKCFRRQRSSNSRRSSMEDTHISTTRSNVELDIPSTETTPTAPPLPSTPTIYTGGAGPRQAWYSDPPPSYDDVQPPPYEEAVKKK